MLKALSLKKVYGHREVVKGVSIQVERGEVVALLGRNGAGKTTTFKMILGVIAPDDGAVVMDGEEITTLPAHRRALKGITYLPQEPSLFRKATVEENLEIVLQERGIPAAQRKKIREELLEEFCLGKVARSQGYTLSGGERRRAELARALTIEPSFFLLDEPFSGVDPLTIMELQGLIRRLVERNIGILISDHNVKDTLEIAHRAYLIDSGSVIVSGSPADILQSDLARERFLGKEFEAGDTIRRL